MLRLFIGIALPPEQCLTLSTICLGLPGAKWVDPGNYHVTLRFIGDTDEAMAADIDTALMRVRSAGFSIAIGGIGMFGTDAKPKTLYAGIDRSPPLMLLHERIEAALGRVGLPPEPRRYQPHVTLARFGGAGASGVPAYIAAHNLIRLVPFAVDRFSLIRSHLTKSGAIYEEIADYFVGRGNA